MASEAICEKCHRGKIEEGKCTVCGFRSAITPGTNALPLGSFLNHGRYRILRVLGEGGYGITYEALDLLKRESVAIKEFFPAYAVRRGRNQTDAVSTGATADSDLTHARMRFNEEAALLISLGGVRETVNAYRSFEDNNTAYYTMELLQGMDMQKRLQIRGRMSWQELSPIVIQIIRALYATHQKGYIHRDITPDNIFLLSNGTAQLIDFGNARRYLTDEELTAVVKDKFSPREQYIRTGYQGPWTDIYSLCVTIYYSLTGILPKKATERYSEMDSLPLLHTVSAVPPEVSRAVQIGMSADESRRYRSIADFAYAMFPGQAILGNVTRQPIPNPGSKLRNGGKIQSQQIHQGSGVTMPLQRQTVKPHSPILNGNSGRVLVLVCTQGIMQGFRLNLTIGQVLSLGRSQGSMIRYPDGADGISRHQCSVELRSNGTVYVRDDDSSYGTALNGRRLASGIWIPMKRGDAIGFGREMYVLY